MKAAHPICRDREGLGVLTSNWVSVTAMREIGRIDQNEARISRRHGHRSSVKSSSAGCVLLIAHGGDALSRVKVTCESRRLVGAGRQRVGRLIARVVPAARVYGALVLPT